MTTALARPFHHTPLAHSTPATPRRGLRPQEIRPQLISMPRQHGALLGDEGYIDSAVTIGLCAGLGLKLVSRAGLDITHRHLTALPLSIRRAWNVAAHNVIEASRTERGCRFLTRPAHGGLEVTVREGYISAWLAHPASFNVLNEHLCQRMRCTELIYLVAHDESLVVVPKTRTNCARAAALLKLVQNNTVSCAVTEPLLWSHGFPRPLSSPKN